MKRSDLDTVTVLRIIVITRAWLTDEGRQGS